MAVEAIGNKTVSNNNDFRLVNVDLARWPGVTLGEFMGRERTLCYGGDDHWILTDDDGGSDLSAEDREAAFAAAFLALVRDLQRRRAYPEDSAASD